MKVTQVSTSSCETIYDVDGVRVRLWIITGGTPALAFEDWGYTERYPAAKHMWSDQHWMKELGDYIHQDPDSPIGPGLDVLPEGETTLEKYVAENLPKKTLAKTRFDNLPVHETIYSKRMRDREGHTIVQAKIEINPNRVSSVSVRSKWYAGQYTEKLPLFGPWWVRAAGIFNAIQNRMRYEMITWDRLTEDEYKAVVQLLSEKH